ncbi:hypothetical protein ACFPYI_05450 [Halomarina salina]|uniref:Uncharacterized protein n=1 Tax=Halomarina salina TaxID=1872699 RepID=A0ABD5RK01_9EURY|nr:hypothetical protein [Halomarina salina]
MPSSETGLFDRIANGFLDLELFVGLLVCSGALGYLAYESLLSATSDVLAVAGGGAVGVLSAVVLVTLARRVV